MSAVGDLGPGAFVDNCFPASPRCTPAVRQQRPIWLFCNFSTNASQALVPELAIKTFDVPVLHGSSRLDQEAADAVRAGQPMKRRLVNSWPLTVRKASA